jgi:hypothetical protein
MGLQSQRATYRSRNELGRLDPMKGCHLSQLGKSLVVQDFVGDVQDETT